MSRFFSSCRLKRLCYPAVAIVLSITIIVGQPAAAQALNWRDLIPRVLPGLLQTIQLANISDQQEMILGQQIDQQLTREQFKILQDRQLTAYVNAIGQRLVRRSPRQGIDYTFQVVDDTTLNAAATMGGFVYINKGIIAAADNEAELASVIAHEIAHIQERHSIEQAKNTALAQTGVAALRLDRNLFANLAMQFGLTMPRNRRFELAADEVGLRLLSNAGYSPQAMISFMRKLDTGGRGAPNWLSTHPGTGSRIQQLQVFVNQIPNPGTDGTDRVAYARRVGKPTPNQPAVTQPVAPLPSRQPVLSPRPVAQPGFNGIIVPTE